MTSFDVRLRILEAQLGLLSTTTTTPKSNNNNNNNNNVKAQQQSSSSSSSVVSIEDRLLLLERKYIHNIPSTLRDVWNDNDHMLRYELHPLTALTHQQQIIAPILYRRQEILANKTSILQDMKYMSEIIDLLFISSTNSITSGSNNANNNNNNMISSESGVNSKIRNIGDISGRNGQISVEYITNAPILLLSKTLSNEEQERLQTLIETLLDIQRRIENASKTLDRLLTQYESFMIIVNEKMVHVEEELRMAE